MKAKPVLCILLILLGILQYKLWLSKEGVAHTVALNDALSKKIQVIQKLQDENTGLSAEVADLREGQEAIEEHARTDLGMTKPGEEYYQVQSKQ